MKRKICCFLESWDFGGIEALLTDVLTASDLSDLKIDIVAARIYKNAYADRLEKFGIRFIELSGKLRSVKNFALFEKILKKENYDAVHFNIFHAVAMGYVHIAKKLGVKTRIVHAHGAGLRKTKTRAAKLALHYLSRFLLGKDATHRLACSQRAAKFLFGNRTATIISNGIKTDKFTFNSTSRTEIRKELGIENERLIGHVGRMSSEKNQVFLLDVFKLLCEDHPDYRLALIGDGPLLEEYQEYAKKLGVAERIFFLGNQKNTPEWLSAFDVFAFPSIVEGLGIAAVEAQASGLWTICSTGLPPEARATDRFISLPIDDARVWSNKIAELPTADSREAYAKTVSEAGFDISDTAKSIMQLYRGDNL